MRFANELDPTEPELQAWAAEPDAAEPVQDWDLVLAWGMEPGRLRLFVELASDPSLPNGQFFLMGLYAWVSTAARRDDFESWRAQYDRWLDRIGSTKDPKVRRWRHRARRIFQGVDTFDLESWWADFSAETESA